MATTVHDATYVSFPSLCPFLASETGTIAIKSSAQSRQNHLGSMITAHAVQTAQEGLTTNRDNVFCRGRERAPRSAKHNLAKVHHSPPMSLPTRFASIAS